VGIRKVRLTGGEPTLRPDLLQIVQDISEISGVEKIALTTNGYRLTELAEGLKLSGVNAINVSVDSLNPKRFFEITGQDRFHDVMKGIEAARRVGIDVLKINAVLLKGINESEIEDFIHWAERESLSIRFIELMPTADNGDFFKSRHLSLAFFETMLQERGWGLEKREEWAGPANVWSHPSSKGKVGLIRPYSSNFCDSCNRLRVTSEGDLQLCLFGKGNVSLRHLLQENFQKDELEHFVRSTLAQKQFSHFLHEGDYGSTRNFATMGG
jgi:cyclic pyranopterin phosphate synthase